MFRNSMQIAWIALVSGSISILYFVSLLVHLPVYATAALILAAAYFLYKGLMQLVQTKEQPVSRREEILSYLLLITGLFLLVNKGYYLAEKYGGWDAWAIWNYHALFLKDPAAWKTFLDNSADSHPDYPLFLPALSAFFWRLSGGTSTLVPFSISVMISLLIPVWIYLETYRKNIIVAGTLLILIATDEAYLTRSLSQYADHMLGLFFMGSFICFDHFKADHDRRYLLLTGALLGLCLWIKNEGLMLVFIFTAFNLPAFFNKEGLKYFFAGILIPLVTYTLFKFFYAPSNDLIEKGQYTNATYFTDTRRYNLIYEMLKKTIRDKFQYHRIAGILYIILCIAEKKTADRNFIIILACLTGYLGVYLITPYDLQWHLNTSLDRLLHQLAPAFLYTVSLRLCDVKLLLPQKDVL